jgi:hypothetical protein
MKQVSTEAVNPIAIDSEDYESILHFSTNHIEGGIENE